MRLCGLTGSVFHHLLVRLDQGFDDRGIGEGREVAHVLVLAGGDDDVVDPAGAAA